MRQIAILFILAAIGFSSHAQDVPNDFYNCYNILLKEGKRLFYQEKYAEAIQQLESAFSCRAFQKDTLDFWLGKTNQTFIASLQLARDSAYRQAVLSEASRLALLSSNVRENNEYKEALYLAHRALHIAGPAATQELQLAFGEAVYGYFQDTLLRGSGQVNSFQWMPGNKQLLVLVDRQLVKILEVDSNKQRTLFTCTDCTINHLAVSPTGTWVALGTSDAKVRLLPFGSGNPITLEGHTEGVTYVGFSPDGQQLVSCSRDDTSKRWDLSGRLLADNRGHQGNVYYAEFAPAGDKLLTRSSDGSIIIWDETGMPLSTYRDGQPYVHTTHFMQKGEAVMIHSRTGRLSDRMLATSAGKPWGEGIRAVTSLHAYNQMLLQKDQALSIYQENGSLIHNLDYPDGRIEGVAVAEERQLLMVYGEKIPPVIRRFTGETVTPLAVGNIAITGADFLPGTSWLITYSSQGGQLFDAEGNNLMGLETSQPVLYDEARQSLYLINNGNVISCLMPSAAFQKIEKEQIFAEDWKIKMRRRFGLQDLTPLE